MTRFSALQRAEFAEMPEYAPGRDIPKGFSALQRAEIAEIQPARGVVGYECNVSVLFNEPKLLK